MSGPSLIPIGPQVPQWAAAILQSMADAITALQQPGSPSRLCNIDLKANLPPASDWPECAAICDEINSVVVSTQVAGTYTWLRSDGSAL